MKKSDMRELRKVVKNQLAVEKVYCLYVDTENNVFYEKVRRLSEMEEAERGRHLDILTGVLPTSLGKKVFPAWLEEQNQDLIALKDMQWTDKEIFAGFRETLLENYSHLDPYYAVAARIVYDVPAKTKDKFSTGESEEVYTAMLLAICPAKLSGAELGVQDKNVVELQRRWVVKRPELGFLYPTFDERGENRNEVALFGKDPAADHLISTLFHMREQDMPASLDEQQERFEALLSDLDVDMEKASHFTKAIAEKAAEDKESDAIEKATIRRCAEICDIDTTDFEEYYENDVGTTKLTEAALVNKSVTIETGDFKLSVPTEKSDLIQTRKVDGVNYILIPIDGDIKVNGADTALKPGEQRQELSDF